MEILSELKQLLGTQALATLSFQIMTPIQTK